VVGIGIVDVAAAHAGEPEEVLREEHQVDAHNVTRSAASDPVLVHVAVIFGNQ